MNMFQKFSVIFIAAIIMGCSPATANISESRKAYILSQSHGWVEIQLIDSEIPAMPKPGDLTPDQEAAWQPRRPDSCRFSVYLNNEKFLYEPVFPYGETPPYRIDTGFRFPVPIGEYEIEMRYEGCDIEEVEGILIMGSTILKSRITVEEALVTPVVLQGDVVVVRHHKRDNVVTLNDVINKLEEMSSK